MITGFPPNDRRRKIERRRSFLTIHFSDRRTGLKRRTVKGQRTDRLAKRGAVKARNVNARHEYIPSGKPGVLTVTTQQEPTFLSADAETR
jgi:hypothetical protein